MRSRSTPGWTSAGSLEGYTSEVAGFTISVGCDVARPSQSEQLSLLSSPPQFWLLEINFPAVSLFTYLCVARWAHLGPDWVSYMELNFVTVGSVEGRCPDNTSRDIKSHHQMWRPCLSLLFGLCCLLVSEVVLWPSYSPFWFHSRDKIRHEIRSDIVDTTFIPKLLVKQQEILKLLKVFKKFWS